MDPEFNSPTVPSPSWLRDVLDGRTSIRYADPSATLLEQLISVYNRTGPAEQPQFDRAIVDVLTAIRPGDVQSDVAFHVLQLVAHAKPLEAPLVLQKILLSRELLHAGKERGHSLEALAAQTHAEYGVPEWLVDFLVRRSLEGDSIPLLLAALELLAFRGNAPLSVPLAKLCAHPEVRKPSSSLVLAAFTSMRRAGMHRWAAALSGDGLESLASAVGQGRTGMLRACISAADKIGQNDPWYPALRAVLAVLADESPAAYVGLAALQPDSAEILAATIKAANTAAKLLGREAVVFQTRNSEYLGKIDGDAPVDGGLIVDRGKAFQYVPVMTPVEVASAVPTPGFAQDTTLRASLLEEIGKFHGRTQAAPVVH